MIKWEKSRALHLLRLMIVDVLTPSTGTYRVDHVQVPGWAKYRHSPILVEFSVPHFTGRGGGRNLSRGEHVVWQFQRNKEMKQFCSHAFDKYEM